MGEKKQKRRRHQHLLEKYPWCTYCGGKSRASTVDHVPPRAVFDAKRRPQGLEFPACDPCNRGARLDELVAAFLSRIFPNPPNAERLEEVRKYGYEAQNNFPGLLEEMFSLSATQAADASRLLQQFDEPSGGVLNAQGPILSDVMYSFAAKMAFALHFQLTGKVLPPEGAVMALWQTNVNFMQGQYPQEFIEKLGAPRTLRQGKWHVGEQFLYKSIGSENGELTGHFATFRRSFGIIAFGDEDSERVTPPAYSDHLRIFNPGWLIARDQ